jgi:hypothetical protein
LSMSAATNNSKRTPSAHFAQSGNSSPALKLAL